MESASQTLEQQILEKLSISDGQSTLDLSSLLEVDHQQVIGAIKSIESLGNVISSEQRTINFPKLTPEAKEVLLNGSHEYNAYHAVPDNGGMKLDLISEDFKIGLNQAMKLGWLRISKGDDNSSHIIRNLEECQVRDDVREQLEKIAKACKIVERTGQPQANPLDEEMVKQLLKRKLLTKASLTYYLIKKGKDFSLNLNRPEAELTAELLASGDWKTKNFKPYNFNALGASLPSGHLHPLLKVRSEFLSILTELGFSEMATNRFVESSFWNFDTLFVPQQHPARDVQDTFFLSRPSHCLSLPPEYLEKVKRVHTIGDHGSEGYKSGWNDEVTRRNVLRTHTTAISAHVLYELGQQETFKPVKKFSIDRVFRNETLDATHLAEFHQVEGFVADRDLSLGHLIGIMKEFFGRLGIDQLRFKPAYNPYTEPSMEVFAYHKQLRKWVEVGNSGIFRPEMLLPMGIPEDVSVIAWGLSLERPTMIRYGIDNIRSLVGHKVDLRMVQNNPLCRLDKVY